jgi:alkylation response protein AidB-like acyl-CoA dehydrogenase
MTMDVNAYRTAAKAWLNDHAPKFAGAARRGLAPAADLALGRAWQALKLEAGYGAITFPKIYGGADGSVIEKLVFAEEEVRYDVPRYFSVSLGMPIPMLLRYGSEADKDRLVSRALRGDDIWCQLFSEPAAGSDLAALRLLAVRDGEGWQLRGQKLWTSWAQHASWGIILARTDSTVPKHRGLTLFFVDMRSPGIDVHTVRSISGHSAINEVFFNDVHVPDAQRLGPVGDGFRLAIETLMIERYAVSDVSGFGPGLADFIAFAKRQGGGAALLDAAVRQAIADTYIADAGLGSIHERALEAIAQGQEPGPEGSIRKLLIGRKRQRLSALAMDIMGPAGVYYDPADQTTESFQASWLEAPGVRIAGGTDEILRNTIAERILGLPQDVRSDKDIPFNALPG